MLTDTDRISFQDKYKRDYMLLAQQMKARLVPYCDGARGDRRPLLLVRHHRQDGAAREAGLRRTDPEHEPAARPHPRQRGAVRVGRLVRRGAAAHAGRQPAGQAQDVGDGGLRAQAGLDHHHRRAGHPRVLRLRRHHHRQHPAGRPADRPWRRRHDVRQGARRQAPARRGRGAGDVCPAASTSWSTAPPRRGTCSTKPRRPAATISARPRSWSPAR
jgi:hypothetical protein